MKRRKHETGNKMKQEKQMNQGKNRITTKVLVQKIVVGLIFLAVTGMVIFFANKERPGYTTTKSTGIEFETAEVLEVISENYTMVPEQENVLKGSVELKLKLLTGRYQSDVCFVTNYYSALHNVIVKKGDTVSVRVDTSDEGEYSVSIYNYNRIPFIIGTILLFALLLCLVGGKQGAKAFVGLLYTVLCIFFILLPLSLKGYSPIPLTCVIIFVTSFVCFYLIDGISKKTITAALGSLCGVVVAAVFGQLATKIGGVTTFQMDEAEALLLVKSTFDIELRGLLVSGILIASMGAVMDVSMTISSALEEIKTVNPSATKKELFASGMKIGRDAMGTMANTLVLAFVGNSLNMMVLITSYGVGFTQLMNTDFVAIELIRSVAGSIGIVLTVPCVALLGAVFYTTGEKK